MSVLIKGMEMPETCDDCPFHVYHSHYEYVCKATPTFYPMNLANSKGIRKDWCPLEEVPECEDAVSRKAAINAFDCTDELIVSGSANAQNVMNYINKVIDKINALPSVTPEQRWISVSERLPENSNFYIVTRKGFSVGFIWYSVFHGWEWQEEEQPIAWMPLPAPYQEEGEQYETD